MADLTISGRMMVKTLKSAFKKEYNLTLRIYKGNKFADDAATLASLSEKKVEDFSAKSNMKIGNFEERFEKATGLKVQIASPDDKELVLNQRTLAETKEVYKKLKDK